MNIRSDKLRLTSVASSLRLSLSSPQTTLANSLKLKKRAHMNSPGHTYRTESLPCSISSVNLGHHRLNTSPCSRSNQYDGQRGHCLHQRRAPRDSAGELPTEGCKMIQSISKNLSVFTATYIQAIKSTSRRTSTARFWIAFVIPD